ncbi:MAG: bifunctional 5,10-methylenetetrahydrofolate dehydrogenase/5,10-methenyltetrahydrofolate cyclohydrolase [Coriobacteriales bacterium]|jgi:methylenetetrahydrofolate dehydrogenase (NADP+)/methenyltetrahydrofolate cyclohydrolase|nr:bifunctional 5,10-methylenetetrahydrofolate dehydrogenase/5,10-methenyltetrahydrofolate cyclohydrolase [Coriobacteriales bacterium]
MATVLKGSEVAHAFDAEIIDKSKSLRTKGIDPTLAILRVGGREDDISYEKGVARRAEKVGVSIRNVVLPADVEQSALVQAIESLNADTSVHGVLMFRPLPGHIDENLVRNVLVPTKDIDGITDLVLASVFTGTGVGYAPCTAAACMEILDHYDIDPKGKKAVVVGRSLVVGKPVAMMLLSRNATVTIAHSRTEGLSSVTRDADIVIACVGKAKMLGASYFSAGQIVIDVGINVDEGDTLVGDVDFTAVKSIVGAITPVPGGVGTVTTGVLVKHVVDAAIKTLGQ